MLSIHFAVRVIKFLCFKNERNHIQKKSQNIEFSQSQLKRYSFSFFLLDSSLRSAWKSYDQCWGQSGAKWNRYFKKKEMIYDQKFIIFQLLNLFSHLYLENRLRYVNVWCLESRTDTCISISQKKKSTKITTDIKSIGGWKVEKRRPNRELCGQSH